MDELLSVQTCLAVSHVLATALAWPEPRFSARSASLPLPPLHCLDDAGPAHNGARGGRGQFWTDRQFPQFSAGLSLSGLSLSLACPRGGRHSTFSCTIFQRIPPESLSEADVGGMKSREHGHGRHVELLLAVLHFVATFVARTDAPKFMANPPLMVC